jgi:hypothetical protein
MFQCSACGLTTEKAIPGRVVCRCGHVTTPEAEGKLRLPLGDAVAALTTAVGVKPCGKCKQRQEALNAASLRLVAFIQRSIGHIQPRR